MVRVRVKKPSGDANLQQTLQVASVDKTQKAFTYVTPGGRGGAVHFDALP